MLDNVVSKKVRQITQHPPSLQPNKRLPCSKPGQKATRSLEQQSSGIGEPGGQGLCLGWVPDCFCSLLPDVPPPSKSCGNLLSSSRHLASSQFLGLTSTLDHSAGLLPLVGISLYRLAPVSCLLKAQHQGQPQAKLHTRHLSCIQSCPVLCLSLFLFCFTETVSM